MKRYDSGIKDLSLEIIENYTNNCIKENQDNNKSLIYRIINTITKIKNKNKPNKDNINAFFIKKMNRKYFKDDYLELLECDEETNDEKNFRKVIQEQQKIDDNKYYNKDDTMRRLVYEMDILYDAYNLPDLVISNKEWEIYFNRVNRLFVNNGVEVKFYEHMESVMRLAFAKAMVNDSIEISKNELIEGLDYLKVCDDFKKGDIDNLQEELNKVLNNHKITNINEYKRRLNKH